MKRGKLEVVGGPFLFGVELATHEKLKVFRRSRKCEAFSCQRKAPAEKKNIKKKQNLFQKARKEKGPRIQIPSGAPIKIKRMIIMSEEFAHKALNLGEKNRIIFIAMSKHMFFFRRHAVKFVLERGFTPISQYGIFDYFLLDTLDRDVIRKANNNLMRVSDELYVFGPISDGVLAEIKLMKEWGKPVKYFKISENRHIREIRKEEAAFEDNLERFSNLL